MALENVVNLEKKKTEAELATDLKADMTVALLPALQIMDRAKDIGLTIGFSLGNDNLGRSAVLNMSVIKQL